MNHEAAVQVTAAQILAGLSLEAEAVKVFEVDEAIIPTESLNDLITTKQMTAENVDVTPKMIVVEKQKKQTSRRESDVDVATNATTVMIETMHLAVAACHLTDPPVVDTALFMTTDLETVIATTALPTEIVTDDRASTMTEGMFVDEAHTIAHLCLLEHDGAQRQTPTTTRSAPSFAPNSLCDLVNETWVNSLKITWVKAR